MHLAVASAPVLLLYALVSCTTAAPAVNPISISPSQSWYMTSTLLILPIFPSSYPVVAQWRGEHVLILA